jgi:hypothetical protein
MKDGAGDGCCGDCSGTIDAIMGGVCNGDGERIDQTVMTWLQDIK